MADVGLAMQRAMDKTENMRARAGAMEELEAAGAFDDNLALGGGGQDDIDRQLHELTSQSVVDDDLAKHEGRARPGLARPRPGELEQGSEPAPPPRRSPRDRPDRDRGPVPPARRGRRSGSTTSTTQTVEAVEAGDEERFQQLFEEMLELVRRDGRPLADDELEESDVILPPPDTSFEEAAHEFTGEGLIPD